MKTPRDLEALIEDGVIDEVLWPLRSGKEAAVYAVRVGTEVRCAKVYKDLAQRSFQARAQYQEGRKTRGSRQARSMGKASRFGRRESETQWKNTEVDALYRLAKAGVCVPTPHGFFNGVLIMALVTDAEGQAAPRLGEVDLSAEEARDFHHRLIGDVVRMLALGLIHGDLSEYNVLVAPDGPVLIDFPQVVNAAGNNAARALLLRDVHNLRDTLGRFAPELNDTHYGEEMWALYETGELRADSVLTGQFVFDTELADVETIMLSIEDARQEAEARELGRSASAGD